MYQKQVDNMYFYGNEHRIKKHGIKDDILDILYDNKTKPNEEIPIHDALGALENSGAKAWSSNVAE